MSQQQGCFASACSGDYVGLASRRALAILFVVRLGKVSLRLTVIEQLEGLSWACGRSDSCETPGPEGNLFSGWRSCGHLGNVG